MEECYSQANDYKFPSYGGASETRSVRFETVEWLF